MLNEWLAVFFLVGGAAFFSDSDSDSVSIFSFFPSRGGEKNWG